MEINEISETEKVSIVKPRLPKRLFETKFEGFKIRGILEDYGYGYNSQLSLHGNDWHIFFLRW